MVRRNSEVTLSAIDISKLRKPTNKGTMNKLVSTVAIYYGVALVFAFVLIEELSQLFIPSRTFDLVDMTANIVGIGVAALLCYWLHKFMAKRTS